MPITAISTMYFMRFVPAALPVAWVSTSAYYSPASTASGYYEWRAPHPMASSPSTLHAAEACTPDRRHGANDNPWRARYRRWDRRSSASQRPAPRSRAPCCASPPRALGACAHSAQAPRARGARAPSDNACARRATTWGNRVELVRWRVKGVRRRHKKLSGSRTER